MVLTDRQRADLHAGIHEYLKSRPEEAFQKAALAMAEADPEACQREPKNGNGTGDSTSDKNTTNSNRTASHTPLLEKKWTAIPRLQKKVLELERHAAQNAKIHAHRGGAGGMLAAGGGGDAGGVAGAGARRMLPRLPCQHSLQGHSLVVTSVAVHPVFTVVASGSEDGTIKVRTIHTVGLLVSFRFVSFNSTCLLDVSHVSFSSFDVLTFYYFLFLFCFTCPFESTILS
jgi:platelet-activating factor acetylhydrolase IB subunit alpha